MSRSAMTTTIRRRLAGEIGRIDKQAPFRVALSYPSPYRAGMSSLGFLQIYKAIQAEPGMACERAFLADDEGQGDGRPPLTYEGSAPSRRVPRHRALGGLRARARRGRPRCSSWRGIPALREERDRARTRSSSRAVRSRSRTRCRSRRSPTRSSWARPTPWPWTCSACCGTPRRARRRSTRSRPLPHVFVPARHGAEMPPVAQCDDALLPAWSPIRARGHRALEHVPHRGRSAAARAAAPTA